MLWNSIGGVLRKGLFPLAVIIVSLVVIGCAAAQKSLEERVAPGTEIRVYEVFGMDCPGCHGGVEKLVNKIAGVEASEADWEKKKLIITIKADAKVGDEEIIAAIEKANFTPGKRIK